MLKPEPGNATELPAAISVYTRGQAIEDGILVDVSDTAREAGSKIAVAVTRTARKAWGTPVGKPKERAARPGIDKPKLSDLQLPLTSRAGGSGNPVRGRRARAGGAGGVGAGAVLPGGPAERPCGLAVAGRAATDALVGDAVGRLRPGWRPELAHLVERLIEESAGPHLEKLAAQAEEECAPLDAGIAHAWSAFSTHVADHESYGPSVDEASYRLLDLDMPADEREEIAAARNDALARPRHAALRTLLGGTLDSLSNTVAGAAADALKEGVAAILKDDGLPAEFPDSEWETCREAAERFRIAIVEPGEKELALREASRRYTEDQNTSLQVSICDSSHSAT